VRDIIVRSDSAVLAVLEAVVCKLPATSAWAQGELTSHFQKLLGYDSCRVFFHITYAYVDNPGAVLAELKREASALSPAGFQFLRLVDLPDTDSRPPGFVALYQGPLKEVRVVFLLLDMQQRAQKDAAITADASNPRRGKRAVPAKRVASTAAGEAGSATDGRSSPSKGSKARKQAPTLPKTAITTPKTAPRGRRSPSRTKK
jgi:hypothetical protein